MAVVKLNFLSKSLGKQTNVTICIPSYAFGDVMEKNEDFYVPGMEYQVLWLLHGGFGDDSDYLNFTSITRYADKNRIAVVMPAGDNSMYEDIDYGGKYCTYVAEELPAMCRAIFHFSDKREDNFLGGLSMGSIGSQKIAMKYPENYAAVLAMSAGAFAATPNANLKLDDPSATLKMTGPEVVEQSRALAKKNMEDGKLVPDFFMTWGDKDFAAPGHKESCEFLKGLGYNVYEEVVPGYGHEWDFWDLTLRKALDKWLPIKHSIIYPENK